MESMKRFSWGNDMGKVTRGIGVCVIDVQHKVDGRTAAEDAPGRDDGAASSQLIGFPALPEDCRLAFGSEVVQEEGRMNDVGNIAVVGAALDDEDREVRV